MIIELLALLADVHSIAFAVGSVGAFRCMERARTRCAVCEYIF